MSLGGHNQEKEKSQLDSTQASRIGTSTQATLHVSNEKTQSGRNGTSTWTIHRATEAEKMHSRCGQQSFSSSEVVVESWPKSIGKREERTAPHREDHRHAGPATVVPLQHRTSSSRVEPPNPDHTLTSIVSSCC